jgi:hypothetical protein
MSLLGKWWVPDDVVQKGASLDAQLAELDRAAFESGKISAAEYARRQRQRGMESADTYRDQVDEAFVTGWNEQKVEIQNAAKSTVAAVAKAAGDVVSAPVSGVLMGIPWWLWLVGGVAALAWFGFLPGVLAGLTAALKKAKG